MDEIRCAIEIREDAERTSPGRLYGVLIEYETRASDRPELFTDQSLNWDDDGVVLNVEHDRQQPILRFTPEVRGSQLIVDELLPDTGRGRDAATMVKNGTLRGLSVEFRAERQHRTGGVRHITKAQLHGAALVGSASYKNHLEVRRDAGDTKPTAFTLWL